MISNLVNPEKTFLRVALKSEGLSKQSPEMSAKTLAGNPRHVVFRELL